MFTSMQMQQSTFYERIDQRLDILEEKVNTNSQSIDMLRAQMDI